LALWGYWISGLAELPDWGVAAQTARDFFFPSLLLSLLLLEIERLKPLALEPGIDIHTKLRSEVVFSNEKRKLKNVGDRYQNKVRVAPGKEHLQLALKNKILDYQNDFLEDLPRYVQQALILGYAQVEKSNECFQEWLNS
jgi:hypothetical protein